MGIHVSLTGLRGIVAPICGILIWQYTKHDSGWLVWLIALVFTLVSLIMYRTMARRERFDKQNASGNETR